MFALTWANLNWLRNLIRPVLRPPSEAVMSTAKMVKHRLKNTVLYEGVTPPISEIKQYFSQFKGGSVNLNFVRDGIATITLDNPTKRNAMSGKMICDFHDVVEELEKWEDGKGVILKGFGGNFCSGGDLNMAIKTGTAENGYMMATIVDHILTRLESLPFTSVALVEGCGALGGGAELTLACNYRLVASDCRGIGFVHGRMGIIPAWGGTRRLISIIGPPKAREVLSTPKVIPPNDLLPLGLASEIIPGGNESFEYAVNWLQARTMLPSHIIQGINRQLQIAQFWPEDRDLNNRVFAPFWGGPANRKAIAANIKHTSS